MASRQRSLSPFKSTHITPIGNSSQKLQSKAFVTVCGRKVTRNGFTFYGIQIHRTLGGGKNPQFETEPEETRRRLGVCRILGPDQNIHENSVVFLAAANAVFGGARKKKDIY